MASLKDAQAAVDSHVEPKECFVWYMDNKRGWMAISDLPHSTGCAHYVAHKLGVTKGATCNAGYTIRVPDLVQSMSAVKSEAVQQSDVWTNAGNTHCGLVVTVTEATDAKTKKREIEIEHCSSAQGGVVRNDWASHFHGAGNFYRPKDTAISNVSGTSLIRKSGFPVKEFLA
jgi:hypothetical protein